MITLFPSTTIFTKDLIVDTSTATTKLTAARDSRTPLKELASDVDFVNAAELAIDTVTPDECTTMVDIDQYAAGCSTNIVETQSQGTLTDDVWIEATTLEGVVTMLPSDTVRCEVYIGSSVYAHDVDYLLGLLD